jgi:hypothetical protein
MRTGPAGSTISWLAALAGALVLLGACTSYVGPTRTAEDYALKASSTADAALSAVRTASLVADAADRDRAFGPFVAVALADAEAAASGAASTFESLQPPGPSSDALRDELGPLLTEATDALASLRISARRGDRDALAAQAAALPAIADGLAAFSERHG